jgi:multiple sugar transport system permease protein
MSFKLPVDAFDANPLVVLFGPNTRDVAGGISVVSVVLTLALAYVLLSVFAAREAWLERLGSTAENTRLGLVIGFYLALLTVAALGYILLVPAVSNLFTTLLNGVPVLGALVRPALGLTTQHYETVWFENGFINSF